MSDRRRDFRFLALAVLFYWIGLYLYVPTLPTFIQTRAGNLSSVGIVLSMYGLLMGVFRLPVGIASDRIGRRKPFIVVGMALVGVGAWVMGSSHSIGDLAMGRALTGVAATTWVPLVVLFSGLFATDDAVRVTAILTFVLNVGRILATSLTGLLNGIGGYSLAFYAAAGASAAAILFTLPVREHTSQMGKITARQVVRLIRRSDVLLPAVLSAINLYADYTVTFGFMPILAEQLGANDPVKGALVSLNLGAVAMGSLLIALLARRVGTRVLLWGSTGLLSLGIALAATAHDLATLLVSQLVFGLAAGSGYSVFMGLSIRYVSQADRATAMGLHQAVYAIGMFAGPWMSGLLGDALGIRPMFALTAVLCLVLSGSVILRIGRRSKHRDTWKRPGIAPTGADRQGVEA
jgi:MFS family permease